jgi:KUP system potassium uptake protein
LLTQAHALGFWPRILVLRKNVHEAGQVYIPEANLILCIICLALCVWFQNSAAIGGAYGISVSGTFMVTAVLLWMGFRYVWQWSVLSTSLIVLPMLFMDIMLWSSNMLKVIPGGWVPLALGFVILVLMQTFRWGRRSEQDAMNPNREILSVNALTALLQSESLQRTESVSVFLTPDTTKIPRSLSVMVQANNSISKVIVLLSVNVSQDPIVNEDNRAQFDIIDSNVGLYHVTLRYGYAEPLTAVHLAVQHRLKDIAEQNGLAMDLDMLDSQMAFTFTPPHESVVSTALGSDGSTDGGSVVQPATYKSPALFKKSPSVTFVFNRLNYVPSSSRGSFGQACVRLYRWMNDSLARNPVTFFGLEECNTMEVGSVLFI